MSASGNFDPRIVANYIIAAAHKNIRQIALQKLLYFSHGLYLSRFRKPLVQGYFEAWKFGPVHPTIYASFKDFGNTPITKLAIGKEVRTGAIKHLAKLEEEQAITVINHTLHAYKDFTDFQLVHLSHAPDGPWDQISAKAVNEHMMGLRIPNELILKEFGRHKRSTDTLTSHEELNDVEDAPITYHRFG